MIYANIVESPNGTWFLKKGVKGIQFDAEGRPRVGGFYAYTILYFFEPQPCGMPGCSQRHRTVYEFSEAHPEWAPKAVDLSHLWHVRQSVNPRRMTMEPSTWNLLRNICRQTCQCNLKPKCFTEHPLY